MHTLLQTTYLEHTFPYLVYNQCIIHGWKSYNEKAYRPWPYIQISSTHLILKKREYRWLTVDSPPLIGCDSAQEPFVFPTACSPPEMVQPEWSVNMSDTIYFHLAPTADLQHPMDFFVPLPLLVFWLKLIPDRCMVGKNTSAKINNNQAGSVRLFIKINCICAEN